MAQFAIDEILTTGIQISGFVFDVSNNIGTNGYVLTSTSSGVMWQQDSSNADLSALSGQIAATGTLLNNRINSLSGYVDGAFVSGSGIRNYVPRWNSARELVTGSIYDLGTGVGIGITNVSSKLEIVHDSGVTTPTLYVKGGFAGNAIARFERIYGVTPTTTYVDINGNGGSAQLSIASANNTFALGVNNNTSAFEISDNSAIGTNTRLLINSNGNVGIGTATPASLLSVGGAGSTSAASGITFGADSSANLYRISTARLQTDGSLTIGGQGGLATALTLNRSSTSNENGIAFNSLGSTDWYYYVDGGNTHLQIQRSSEIDSAPRVRFDGANSNVLFNLGGGNVGIGTASPSGRLHVSGNIYLTADILGNDGTRGYLLGKDSIAGGRCYLILDPDAADGVGVGSDYLYIAQENTTGIIRNPAGTLLLNDNGNNVGLGTSLAIAQFHIGGTASNNNPWMVLDVNDTFFKRIIFSEERPTYGVTGYGGYLGYDAAANTISLGTYHETGEFRSVNIKRENGNVGIGTTVTPLKLNVSGSIYMAAGSGSAISWSNNISSQFLKYDSVTDGMVLSSWAHTTFLTQQTERVRIASNGNVGIGVTNPTTILQLKGDAGSHQIFSINRSGSTTPAVYIGTDGNQNALIASNNTNLLFGKDFVGTFNEYARISSNGNFGIGTSNPNAKLHIENSGTVSSIATVRLVGSTGNNAGSQIEFYKAQNPKASIGLASAVTGGLSDDLLLLSSNPNSIVLTAGSSGLAVFKPDGKVGIGIYNPISLLSIGGTGSTSPVSGITFGLDGQANLYRSAEGTVKTDGSLIIGTDLYVADELGVGVPIANKRFNYGAEIEVASASIQLVLGRLGNATGQGGIGADANNAFAVWNVSGQTKKQFVVSQQGNVGIQEQTPLAPLHVGLGGDWPSTTGTSAMVFIKQNTANAGLVIQEPGDSNFDRALHLYTNASVGTIEATYRDTGPYPHLAFRTSGTERVRIASNGLVGISSNVPTDFLDFGGAGKNIVFGYAAYGEVLNSAASIIGNNVKASPTAFSQVRRFANANDQGNFIKLIYNKGVTFHTNITSALNTDISEDTNERMRINLSGNVIIGNITAYGGLTISDITANDGNDSLAFFYRGTAGAHESLIKFHDFRGQNNASIGNNLQDDTLGGQKADLVFKTARNSSPIERMRITSLGNVGIGTSNPSKPLHIYNTGLFNNTVNSLLLIDGKFNVGSIDTDDIVGIAFRIENSGGGSQITNSIGSCYQAGGNALLLQPEGGNVGIGLKNPIYKLQLQADNPTNGVLAQFYNYNAAAAGANGAFTIWTQYGIADWFIGQPSGVNALTFGRDKTSSATGVEYMRINSAGNIGIGINNPSVKLAVNGEASFGDGSKLTLIGLDINSGATPSFIKIRTKIPFASAAADFTINIKGFRYNSAETTNLSVCWHYYLSTFYNASISSAGSFAPTVKLSAEDWDSSGTPKVCIVLVGPGYWPKLYVESMYSSAYNDEYADGWDWVDADATGTGNNLAILSYKSNFGNNFLMLNNGYVGIGSANPTQRLDVGGYVMAGEGLYRTSTYGTNGGAWISFGDTGVLDSLGRIGAYGALFNINSINGDTSFQYNGSEKMRITTAGNVGIGVTNPGVRLQVVNTGSITSTSTVRIVGATGNGGGSQIEFFKGTSQKFSIGTASAITGGFSDDLLITTLNPSSIILTAGLSGLAIFKTDGKVGIGMYNPTTLLSVGSSGSTAAASGITFGSDPEVNLYRSAENVLKTDGSLIITDSLGVGLSPTQKLQVDGVVGNPALNGTSQSGIFRISNTTDNAVLDFGIRAGGLGAWIQSTDETSLNAYYPLLLNPNGARVGVGLTTNISGILHVRTPAAGDQTLLVLEHSAGYSNNTENRIDFFDDEAHKVAARIAQYYSTDVDNRWGLKFYTNASTAINSIPALTLRGNNNVGIGTTVPATLLHVDTPGADARIRVSAGANTVQGGMIANTGTSLIYAGSITNHGFSLRTNDTDRVRIDTNGNVGINTTVPSSILELYKVPATSGTLQPMLTITSDYPSAITTNFGSSIVFKGRTAGNALQDNAQISAYNEDIGDNGYALGFYTRPTVAAGLLQRLTILRGGNVGVGTTNPNAKLQIGGTSINLLTVGTLTNDWGGVVSIGTPDGNGIILSKVNTANDTNRVLTIMRDDTNGASIFGYTPLGTSTSIGFQIRASGSSYFNGGNVGIGTASPSFKLTVQGITQARGGVYVTQASPTNTLVLNADNTALHKIYTNSTIDLSLGTNYSDTQVYLKNGGNVGLGQNNPIEKLHVQGNVYATDGNLFNFKAQRIPIEGSPQGGTYKGYLILAKAYTSGFVDQSYVIGKVILRRGTSGTGHNVDIYEVNSSRGYNTEIFQVSRLGAIGTRFVRLVKVTYGGVVYHAIETESSGGAPSTEMYFEGSIVESPLILTDESFVSNVTAFGNITIFVDQSSNVGIGTTTPSNKLDVIGSSYLSGIVYVGLAGHTTNAHGIVFGGDSEANIYRAATDTIKTDGNLIVAGNVTAANLVSGSGTSNYVTKWNGTKSITNSQIFDDGTYVGINTASNTTYRLQVNGSFAATTKSFDIVHPTISGKRLIYASLEGPENGVYFRGRNNNNEINLPHYWSGLVHDDSITVDLTSVGKRKDGKIRNYSVDQIGHNKVYIYTDSDDNIYDYYYTIFAERKDVCRLITERDME